MKTKKVSPSKCSEKQLYKMGRDNFEVGDFWILSDTFHVSINKQKFGHPSEQSVNIPRKVFNKLIAWYQRPQVIRK